MQVWGVWKVTTGCLLMMSLPWCFTSREPVEVNAVCQSSSQPSVHTIRVCDTASA